MALTLDPKRCAILAMDFQNEILAMTPQYRETHLLGTVKRVLDAARRSSATIVYITVSFRDDYANAPAHSPLFQEEKARGVMKAGSPGAAICDELTPQVGDMVINKHGVDPFNGTHLANVLRPRDVDTLARHRRHGQRGDRSAQVNHRDGHRPCPVQASAIHAPRVLERDRGELPNRVPTDSVG